MSRAPIVLVGAVVVLVGSSVAAGQRAGPVAADRHDRKDRDDHGTGDGLFPDVLDVTATHADDGTWTFDVTISSPYDTPQRYADAWRVLAPDGTELGIRELLHDHAGEQPFTRSLAGVEIPADVNEVMVEARDQLNGWSGESFLLTID